MVVSFDKLPLGSVHVLARTHAKRFAEAITPPEILARITRIHFGCTRRTTQEVRIVARGETFTIRVNFWVEGATSRVLSWKPSWINVVESFGGALMPDRVHVHWPDGAPRRYAAFLLAHEIAHVIYWHQRGHSGFPGRRGGAEEESWCDRWAREAVEVNTHLLASAG